MNSFSIVLDSVKYPLSSDPLLFLQILGVLFRIPSNSLGFVQILPNFLNFLRNFFDLDFFLRFSRPSDSLRFLSSLCCFRCLGLLCFLDSLISFKLSWIRSDCIIFFLILTVSVRFSRILSDSFRFFRILSHSLGFFWILLDSFRSLRNLVGFSHNLSYTFGFYLYSFIQILSNF